MISTVILHAVFLIGNHANLRRPSQSIHRTLNVTIPEDLDYTGIFDDLMQAYTTAHELVRVKTTNMGSMFRLTYRITLREAKLEKSLIDSIRYAGENKKLLDELLRTKKLPLAQLVQGSGVERKTLERHRKYIFTMLLIQTNGYEIIRGHLYHVLKKGGAPV